MRSFSGQTSQTLDLHWLVAPHALSHLPQCSGSFSVFRQSPAQKVSVPSQVGVEPPWPPLPVAVEVPPQTTGSACRLAETQTAT
ncbi:MAG: hypothetical protein FJ096_13120 [Deltaproteobacteria bacterium]|nr:hypothetical protein [Deltaproteobacteria bacterium]